MSKECLLVAISNQKGLWTHDERSFRMLLSEGNGDSQFYEGKFMFKRT